MEGHKEGEEKEIIFVSDEPENMCDICQKSTASIKENGIFICTDCFYEQKKELLKMYLNRTEFHPNFSQITDKIYLGNEDCAFDKTFLEDHGITNILVCGMGIIKKFEGKYEYLSFDIDDSTYENILIYFYEAFKFIYSAKGKVLVHCVMGISRSSSFVIGFIMFDQKLSLNDAFKFVFEKRKIISPNPGFIKQLKYFEEVLQEINYDLEALKNYQFNEEKWKNIQVDDSSV